MQLESLLSNIPGVVYRCCNDRDRTMEFVSEGVRELTGHVPEDFLSGRIRFGDLVFAQDRERSWRESQAALASRVPYALEYRIRTAEGAEKWVWERGSGVYGPDGSAQAMEGFVGDVTERKRAGEALRESEARLRSLVGLSSDWYWEQDAEFRFVSVSERYADLGGINAETHFGLPRWGLPGTEIVGQTWDEHRALLAAHKPFRDLRLRRTSPTGEIYYISVAGEPIFDEHGSFTGYRGVARDVTDRVIAGQRARAADERMRLAIEHLGEAISITDAGDRIVLGNRYFRELNGNTRLVEPGHLYEEHLRAGIAIGNYPEAIGREEEWLAERQALRRAGGRMILRRQNGKWLQVTDQRLPDGGVISVGLDITASKEAELSLRASERRFRDFAEAGLDWFWETDAEGRYIWFSDSVERIGGAKPEWHYGKKRTDLAAASYDLSVEPWKSHLETLERHEPFRDFRYERAGPNGNNWLSVSGVPYFDESGAFAGYRGSGTDVTQIVEAEKRERESRNLLGSALENLGEMICLTDRNDRIVLSNRHFVEFNAEVAEFVAIGCRYDEHLRAGIERGMFPDAIGREEAWLTERLALRRSPKGAVERRRQDGRWLLVDDQVLPDGSVITYGVEITERKLAEETLRNNNAELERRVAERTAQLEASNRELESFSYSVSHDLRAPLRAVTGFAKILLQEEGSKLSAEGRRYLNTIDSNGRRMGELIDALIALGRYSRIELNKASVDMVRLAREVRDELAPNWPKAVFTIGPLPPAQGNETLLKQLLLNLIGNALKYSAHVAEPRIVLRAEGNRYVISDNGVGFDMEYVGKLFQPFERLHTEREFEGTGIGLAIVKLIVERHGGQVEARSAPGEGATFSFTLGGA